MSFLNFQTIYFLIVIHTIVLLYLPSSLAWLVDEKNRPQSECAELYSEPNFEGIKLIAKDGKEFTDLSQNYILTNLTEQKQNWNNWTASIMVRDTCVLSVCSDAFYDGNCTTFVNNQKVLDKPYNKNISSLTCRCFANCGGSSKCEEIELRENECGRAFIEPGCNTCQNVYVGLRRSNVTYIGAYHNNISSLVVNTGCSLTTFEYRDHDGDLLNVGSGIYENWNASIGSYDCVCENTTARSAKKIPLNKDELSYPEIIWMPSTVENISAMIEGEYKGHVGLLSALRSLKSKRSSQNAYILLLGMTGSGKSATVNFLFDNVKIAEVGQFKSTTSAIHEYRIPVPVNELGISNSELIVIDTPGLGDTRGLENDAQFLATLDNYLEKHKDLKNKIPNIVLVFAKFDDNRIIGDGSTFVKTLRGLDHLRDRLFDKRYSNVIVVLTHYMKGGKKMRKNPKEKITQFKNVVEDYSLFPKPIVIAVAENRPEEEELPMINGFYKLPNGDFYPRNLFEKIQSACTNGIDPIGEAIIRTGFKNPENFNVTTKLIDLVSPEYAKVTTYTGLLSAGNYKYDETEISNLLKNAYINLKPDLKRKYPDTLPYVQRTLNVRNIISMSDVPRTSAGIIRLLKDMRQSPAVILLLKEALNIRVPSLEMNLLTGQSYDLIQDTVLPASPFISNEQLSSDIGYLLPNILTCKIENNHINIFQKFTNKEEYYKARLGSLGIDETIIGTNLLLGKLPNGFNIINEESNNKSMIWTAVREQRLFELILNDKAEIHPDFINKVNDLPSFNETDYHCVQIWKTFFGLYGTHVIKSSHGGGAIDINLNGKFKVDGNLTKTTEIMGETLFRLVQFTEDVFLGKISSLTNFTPPGVTYSLNFRGGDYKYHTSDLSQHGISEAATLLNEWENSLTLQPKMLSTSMSLIPISEIVKRFNIDKSIEIATTAKILFNASLIYVPPPPSPPPPPRNETNFMESFVASYNTQFSKILEELQIDRKRNLEQMIKLQDDMRIENIRRDEASQRMMEATMKTHQEQIKMIREQNERQAVENERRSIARAAEAQAQIDLIKKDSERRAAESERAHTLRIEESKQQMQLIRDENERRAENDKRIFEAMKKNSDEQIKLLREQINKQPQKQTCILFGLACW